MTSKLNLGLERPDEAENGYDPSGVTAVKKQHHYVLPDSILNAIDAIAMDVTMSQADRVAAVVMLTLGYGLYDQLDRLDPTTLAIPESQWLRVQEALVKGVPYEPSAANLGLSFMNYGPSAYKESE